MGLFSFIKDAGAKIFGGKTSAEEAAEQAADKQAAIKEANLKAAASLSETLLFLKTLQQYEGKLTTKVQKKKWF